MRFIVELRRTSAHEVEGVVTREGPGDSKPFSGWLELLRLLEELDSDAAEE